MWRFVLWVIVISLLLQVGAQYQSYRHHWSVKQLVEYHQQLRPDLQVQDVYKILYQANFGVEHILTDTAGVRTYVLEELASMDTTDRSEPLLERISTSGEMVRVNLRDQTSWAEAVLRTCRCPDKCFHCECCGGFPDPT